MPTLICFSQFASFAGLGGSSREAEVAELDGAGVVDKDVPRLDISVHHVGRVQEVDRTQHVVEQNLGVFVSEVLGHLLGQKLLQVPRIQIHHQEDPVCRRHGLEVAFTVNDNVQKVRGVDVGVHAC